MAVIGARKHNGSVGAAYVFRDNGASDWQQIGKLTPNDSAALSEFGTSVAISGNTILVGAPFNSNAPFAADGAVYVFHDNGSGIWNPAGKLLPSDGAINKQFGTAVAFSSNTAVIGAINDNTTAGNAGAAYVFQRDGLLAWHQIDKLTASDAMPSDRLGTTVALSGNTAVVGTNQIVGATGTAYVFRDNGVGNWQQVGKLWASDAQADSSFGEAVSISGTTAFVGAALANNNPNITDSGTGYFYALPNSLAGDYNKNLVVEASDYVFWRNQVNQSGAGLAADGNGDGTVNQADYLLWRENFGIVAGVVGDYNKNGLVDTADYVVWRNQENQSGPGLAADGNGDGVVNQADYLLWRQNFGLSSSTSAGESITGAPEPTTAALLWFAAGLLGCRRCRSASSCT